MPYTTKQKHNLKKKKQKGGILKRKQKYIKNYVFGVVIINPNYAASFDEHKEEEFKNPIDNLMCK